MDPLTQATIGAVLPQSIARKSNAVIAGIFGFLSGMAPDLDVLIRSTKDPLLFLEYHRQFTHSLIFIPIGGLMCAIFLHWLIGKRRHLSFKESVLFCTLGYATHGVLDACTSYGTMLFWPFSDERVSWNTISIIDPFFTLPILSLLILAGVKKKSYYSQIALVWAFVYMYLGMTQRDTAVEMAKDIAQKRGHEIVGIEAKPSFANILVWKTIYETPKRFYVDAVRTGPSPRIFLGTSLPKLNLTRDFPWLDTAGQQAIDIGRFTWFSDGYVAKHPIFSNRVIDIRYSMIPNEITALWSIKVSPTASKNEHVEFLTDRDKVPDRFKRLLKMLLDNE